PVLPSSAPVARGSPADVGCPSVTDPADLESGDDGRSPRGSVRLDLARVLAQGVAVRILRDLSRHDLAVARDAVALVDADDVAAAPAGGARAAAGAGPDAGCVSQRLLRLVDPRAVLGEDRACEPVRRRLVDELQRLLPLVLGVDVGRDDGAEELLLH